MKRKRLHSFRRKVHTSGKRKTLHCPLKSGINDKTVIAPKKKYIRKAHVVSDKDQINEFNGGFTGDTSIEITGKKRKKRYGRKKRCQKNHILKSSKHHNDRSGDGTKSTGGTSGNTGKNTKGHSRPGNGTGGTQGYTYEQSLPSVKIKDRLSKK